MTLSVTIFVGSYPSLETEDVVVECLLQEVVHVFLQGLQSVLIFLKLLLKIVYLPVSKGEGEGVSE